jgi:hypothetical protein
MRPCAPTPPAWPSCAGADSRTSTHREAAFPRALWRAILLVMEKLRPIAVTTALFGAVPVAMGLVPMLVH